MLILLSGFTKPEYTAEKNIYQIQLGVYCLWKDSSQVYEKNKEKKDLKDQENYFTKQKDNKEIF